MKNKLKKNNIFNLSIFNHFNFNSVSNNFIIRFIKDKEDTKRFIEKFCFISKKRISGNLIWFHAASVGELMSIIPLIKKLETENKIKTILITTSTLSSSRIIKNYKFKKLSINFFQSIFLF